MYENIGYAEKLHDMCLSPFRLVVFEAIKCPDPHGGRGLLFHPIVSDAIGWVDLEGRRPLALCPIVR